MSAVSKLVKKADDGIQFVPNLTSVEGDGLQMWMNALQSGKDVHCNLTNEDGYLTITLVEDTQNIEKETNKKENTSLDDPQLVKSSIDAQCDEDIFLDDSEPVEWGMFCNKNGDIVAHPVDYFFNNEEDFICDVGKRKSALGNCNQSDTLMSYKESQLSTKHTVIVTVAPEQPEPSVQKEVEALDRKIKPADPESFPCFRNEWFKKHGRKICSDYDDIDTALLATDLRNFLRHYSISISSFAKECMDRTQGTVSDLLNHPKPWSSLQERGKLLYVKMVEFLSSENLQTKVEELCNDNSRRGPPTAKLQGDLLEFLAQKKMPSTKLLLTVAQEYKLNINHLKLYCSNQLKQHSDSVGVVVEFGDDDDTSERDLESLHETVNSTVHLNSGFAPKCTDRQICPIFGCGCILSSKITLKTHMLTHFGQKPYTCKVCKMSFRTASNLRVHETRHSKDIKQSKRAKKAATLREREKIKCKLAKDIRRLRTARQESKRCKYDDLSATEKVEKNKSAYSCGVCSWSFSSTQLLRSHVKNYHVTAVMHDREKVFLCEVCKKSFKTSTAVIAHQKTHEEDDLRSCRHCSKRFSDKRSCARHEEAIHSDGKPYKCLRCPTMFSDPNALIAHARVHTGDKPYVCKDCGKEFTQSGTLASHRLLHTDEFPFLCATCGKGFRQRSNLCAHEERHLAEKAFVCETCQESFVSKLDLQRHMWKHNKEHRFVCSKCTTSFSRISYLNEHARKVHNILPYKCKKCGKDFSTKASFMKHQPCVTQEIKSGASKIDHTKSFEATSTDNSTANLQMVQVFPRAVDCIPTFSTNPETEWIKNPQLSVAMPTDTESAFLAADSASSFSLADSSIPVAIVTDRGYVLTSSKGMDASLIEPGESYELLSKISIPRTELSGSRKIESDTSQHSAVALTDTCDANNRGILLPLIPTYQTN